MMHLHIKRRKTWQTKYFKFCSDTLPINYEIHELKKKHAIAITPRRYENIHRSVIPVRVLKKQHNVAFSHCCSLMLLGNSRRFFIFVQTWSRYTCSFFSWSHVSCEMRISYREKITFLVPVIVNGKSIFSQPAGDSEVLFTIHRKEFKSSPLMKCWKVAQQIKNYIFHK